MLRKIIVIMLLGFFLTAQGTTVYESKDAEGNPSFSDIPSPDAQQIELSSGTEDVAPSTTPHNSTTPPASPTPAQGSPQGAPVSEEDKENAYSLLQLVDMNTNPEQALQLNAAATGYIQQALGNVNIGIFIAPDIQPGDTIEIVLDGDVKFAATQLSTFTLDVVDPGQHTLIARVVSNEGEVLKTSNQITLSMHRAAGGQGGGGP